MANKIVDEFNQGLNQTIKLLEKEAKLLEDIQKKKSKLSSSGIDEMQLKRY